MQLEKLCIKDTINHPTTCCKVLHLNASACLLAICNPFLRVSTCKQFSYNPHLLQPHVTSDHVHVCRGGVAHRGLAGVAARV